MEREQVMRKIQACLRLAASDNPHEAAAALRQARALMAKHGLTQADADAADVSECEAPTGFRGGTLPTSLLALANLVADGYGCEIVMQQRKGWAMRQGRARPTGSTVIRFFGHGAAPRIAAYAFAVLRRQLAKDRASYTRRIRVRLNKERRGEEFSLGWVSAIARLFPRAELTSDQRDALGLAVVARCGKLGTTSGKGLNKKGKAGSNDRWAGYDAGQRATIKQGLDEGQKQLEVGL